jgi:hypothetical protein
LSAQWRGAAKHLGDILTVYGHGLLAFGIGKVFVGQIDLASGFAVALGLVCHGVACYIGYHTEPA